MKLEVSVSLRCYSSSSLYYFGYHNDDYYYSCCYMQLLLMLYVAMRFPRRRLPTRRAQVCSCLVALAFGGIQRSECRTELKDRLFFGIVMGFPGP